MTAGALRWARNIRIAVPVCVVLICGSFAAAAALQMRLDRLHALNQAGAFESARAHDIAGSAGVVLDRYARLGALFAQSAEHGTPAGDIRAVEPLIRDIILFDRDGVIRASLKGAQTLAPALPPAALAGGRAVLAKGIAFGRADGAVAVLFNPTGLAPASLLARAALEDTRGIPIASGAGWRGDVEQLRAPVPGWPLTAVTEIDSDSALASWTGTLPLYLFVIVGPAIVGGWLATLLVGTFERHARAAKSLRALKATRPVEARLLVRLANAERGAAEASRSKSEFIAHMSHELRTPLNAVIGFSEVIAQGFFGPAGHPKYVEYAGDIADAGRNLHAKIGDILEFANIEAGRYPFVIERVELAAIAAEVIADQQGRAFSRRITLETGFCEPGTARADAKALKRILSNLIDNALTYTREGGRVRLEVRFEEGAGVVRLSDNGQGFSGDERRRAGKAFRRFDRDGAVTGAGLGLAIAFELARAMGGAVRLASLQGEGSVMEVRLHRF